MFNFKMKLHLAESGVVSRSGILERPYSIRPANGGAVLGRKSINCFKKPVKRGFTFIELLFVIAIISVIVGVSMPQMKAAFIRIQFNDFCVKLQSLMNYIHDRSVVEQEVMSLVIDNKNKRYWAEYKDFQKKERIYYIPEGIELETDSERIFFYPSADIDKFTIKIKAQGQKDTLLTTKGVFGGVRIEAR